jgi:hypothetical protein
MSYPAFRSMNGELDQGATEGTYKTVIRNRGGVVEGLTQESRQQLSDVWFGIHEAPLKRRPDGPLVHTPYYRWTPAVEGTLGLVG